MVEIYRATKAFGSTEGADFSEFVNRCLASGENTVLVDFQDTLFMDSAGLGKLVTSIHRLRRKKGDLILCGVQGQTMMTLSLVGLDKLFRMYPSVEAYKEQE